ncbi:MAG: ABC transporter permease [Acidobacteriaceae bacterium]|nr:ABC transporter permease [Acidobacteriaceae bacterium]
MWIDVLKRDIRLAVRMLRRAPGIAAIAILSLALGIGANTIIFTLMKQVVLDSLPVPDPQQLVILHNIGVDEGHVSSDGMKSSFSYPLYRDLNAVTGSIFEGIAARQKINLSVTEKLQTERVQGEMVSGNFFSVLRVKPWRGRLLEQTDDEKPGGHPVAVLGYGFWRSRFGGDSEILGHTILLDKHPYTVVGIAPPEFYGLDFGQRSGLFVPIAMKEQLMPGRGALLDRLDHWASLVGRLKPGVTIGRASAALRVIYPPLRDQDLAFMHSPSPELRQEFSRKRIDLSPGGKGYSDVRDQFGDPLRLLMVMVGVVLLITLVNVANLLIARTVARQREMAIRLSVGAGRSMLIRQLLVEGLTLAAIGGSLGVALAFIGTPLLFRFLKGDFSEAAIVTHPDWPVLVFTAVTTLLTGLGFAILPAWQSARTGLTGALKVEGSMGHTGEAVWIRRLLIIGQLALSLVLVTAGILFTSSLRNLKNLNLGFRTDHLVTFEVDPSAGGYSQARIKSFGENVRKALLALPGVQTASLATVPLLEDDDWGSNITVEGYRPRSRNEEVLKNLVGPEFFKVLQIPLLAGRPVLESDAVGTSKVAVVNEAFRKHYLADRNPIGVHFAFGGGNVKMDWTIVGVVADSEHVGLRAQIQPFVYMPYFTDDNLHSLTFYIRTRAAEKPLMSEVRNLLRRSDSSLPLNHLKTMSGIVDENLFVERGLGLLSVSFAFLATLLAVVGLYGVMSYSVSRRYREIGIRMAIGATPQRVLTMVMAETIIVGLAGIACAIPVMLGLRGFVRSVLYGIKPDDPRVWVGAAILLLLVAVSSGAIPAANASRIDPHEALRAE